MLHEFIGITGIDGPYWSLSVEITFYFLIAILIGFKFMRHIDWFLLCWLGFAAIPHLAHSGTPLAILFFPGYAPFFAAGILFYLLQQPLGRTRLRYALLFVAYGLAVKSATSQAPVLSASYNVHYSQIIIAGSITFFFILFALISFRKIDLSRFTWLAWLGALTYPLYLVHSEIAFIAFCRIGHLFNKYVLLGTTILVMLIAAYLIHVLVEKRYSKTLGTQANKLLTWLDQKV